MGCKLEIIRLPTNALKRNEIIVGSPNSYFSINYVPNKKYLLLFLILYGGKKGVGCLNQYALKP